MIKKSAFLLIFTIPFWFISCDKNEYIEVLWKTIIGTDSRCVAYPSDWKTSIGTDGYPSDWKTSIGADGRYIAYPVSWKVDKSIINSEDFLEVQTYILVNTEYYFELSKPIELLEYYLYLISTGE